LARRRYYSIPNKIDKKQGNPEGFPLKVSSYPASHLPDLVVVLGGDDLRCETEHLHIGIIPFKNPRFDDASVRELLPTADSFF